MITYSDDYFHDLDSSIKNIPNFKYLEGKIIYITGITGLICSAVADILLFSNKKYKLEISLIFAGRSIERVRDRFSNYQEGKDYIFTQFDAINENGEKFQTDYIIHGAGNADPVSYTSQPVETMLANLIGINKLLKMAVEKGNQRLLYVSSSEVYGQKKDKNLFIEGDYGFIDILNPRASYPCAKRAAETLCIAYGQEYNVDTVIVRPGHIFGPCMTTSDSRAASQFARNAAAGKDIIMKSTGSQLRSYCYDLDCASALLTVLINGEKGNAYNISNPNSIITIKDLAEGFADAAGTKVVFTNSTDLEKKGYNLMENSSLDSTKLESLGWKPKFSLKDATRRTVEEIKNNELV